MAHRAELQRSRQSLGAQPVNTLNSKPNEVPRRSYPLSTREKRPLPLEFVHSAPKRTSTPASDRSASSTHVTQKQQVPKTSPTPGPSSSPAASRRDSSPIELLLRTPGKRTYQKTPAQIQLPRRKLGESSVTALLSRAKPEFTQFSSPRRTLALSDGEFSTTSSSTVRPLMQERDDVQFQGLRNLGNTCYVNAVLQAMLSLARFQSDMASQHWQQLLSGSTVESSCMREMVQVRHFVELSVFARFRLQKVFNSSPNSLRRQIMVC